MKRKNPRSHTYTILSLLVVIVAVSAFLVNNQLPDESKVVSEERPSDADTRLQVQEGSGAPASAVDDGSALLQSPAPGLQSAGDVKMYESYDNQSATHPGVQPQ